MTMENDPFSAFGVTMFSLVVPPGNSTIQEEVGWQRPFAKTSQLLHGHNRLGMQY